MHKSKIFSKKFHVCFSKHFFTTLKEFLDKCLEEEDFVLIEEVQADLIVIEGAIQRDSHYFHPSKKEPNYYRADLRKGGYLIFKNSEETIFKTRLRIVIGFFYE